MSPEVLFGALTTYRVDYAERIASLKGATYRIDKLARETQLSKSSEPIWDRRRVQPFECIMRRATPRPPHSRHYAATRYWWTGPPSRSVRWTPSTLVNHSSHFFPAVGSVGSCFDASLVASRRRVSGTGPATSVGGPVGHCPRDFYQERKPTLVWPNV
jgi:hypothetical protein